MLQHYLDKILPILSSVKDDEEKLAKILSFLEAEILPEIEEEDDTIEIPEKFEAVVDDIAQGLEASMVCHLNLMTLEVEELPKNYLDEILIEDEEGFEIKHTEWEHVLSFEPLDSSEGFRMMVNFARQIDNDQIRGSLLDILDRKKPFANFNYFIHNSKYREDWFAFKNETYKQHVRQQIYWELNKAKEI